MEMVKVEPEIHVPADRPVKTPEIRRDYCGLLLRCGKQVLVLLFVAALAYGCFRFSQRHVLQAVQVTGVSMSPTLPDSNWYLLNRLVYHFREPRPGDVVVLRDPQIRGYAIKRIIAKPGDSVYIQSGQVYVNGTVLHEPYLKPDTQTYSGPDYAAQFWICGVGHYFVLGDNRNNSTDSRIYGTVPLESIQGMVMY